MMRDLLIACTALLALAGPVRAEEPPSTEAACAAFVDSARDVDAWTRPLYERGDLAALGLPACEARLEAAPEDASLMAAVGLMRILAGPENGRALLERAAERGERLALEALFFWRISGVEDGEETLIAPDAPLAFDYGHRAAEAGSILTQFFLGKAYMSGFHVPEDRGAAIKWLRRAARSDDPEISAYLGDALIGPPPYRGVSETDAREALGLIKDAADRGSAHGLYMKGELMSVLGGADVETVMEVFKRAARKGHKNAAVEVGTYYGDGFHVEKDVEESERFFCMGGAFGRAYSEELHGRPPECSPQPNQE